MSNSVAARRYGVALFELAQQKGQVDIIQQDQKKKKKVFQANGELEQLLDNPKLTMTKKKELLANLFKDANQLIQNTLFIMLEKNRLAEIVDTIDEFVAYANESAGVAEAKVFSTRALTEEESQGISTAFAAKVGRQSLEIENIIDPSLIGGIRLQIGNRIYDGSLSGKLERMQKDLIGS